MAKKKASRKSKKKKTDEVDESLPPTEQEQPADEAPGEPTPAADLPPPPEPHEGPVPDGVVNGIIKAEQKAAATPATPKVDSKPLSFLEEMEEIESETASTESELARHASEVNACKSRLKALGHRMREAVRRARTGQTGTLFVDPAETSPPVGSAVPADAPADPDAWKAAPIASLEIPPSKVKALTEAGIDTVGKLASFTESGNRLTKIRGIGKAAVDKISDAAERFHERRAASVPQNQMSSSSAASA